MKDKPKKVKLPTKKQIDAFAATIVRAKLKDQNVDVYTTLLELYKRGVTYIDAEFSGSGDSGDMYGVSYYPNKENTGYRDDIDIGDVETEKFRDWLCDLFQDKVTCDWCNNDGGGGHVYIELPSMEVKITSYWNETVSNEMDDINMNINPCEEEK